MRRADLGKIFSRRDSNLRLNYNAPDLANHCAVVV